MGSACSDATPKSANLRRGVIVIEGSGAGTPAVSASDESPSSARNETVAVRTVQDLGWDDVG